MVGEPAQKAPTTSKPASDPIPAETVTERTAAPAPAPAASAPSTKPYAKPSPPGTPSEPEPQAIPDAIAGMHDHGSAPPTDAETLTGTAARLAQDSMEVVSERVAGMVERVSGEVKRATDLLGALLGTDAPEPVKELLEQVDNVVANIAQALGDAQGALPSGGGYALDPTSTPMATPLAFFGLTERITEPLQQAGTAMANVAQATGGALSERGPPNPSHKPFAPPPVAPPPLAPVVPSAPTPLSYSSFSGASGSSTDAFKQLFFVLVLLLVAHLQGGKLSWYRLDPLRPHSAVRLPVELPG